MKDLISMVDFVLKEHNELHEKLISDYNRLWIPESYDRISNYANFLKQPLMLGMFVPCDENGNILTEPFYDPANEQYWAGERFMYDSAKEKVLFKGFERKNKITSLYYSWGEIKYLIFRNGNVEFYGIDNSQEDRPKHKLKTIEDLLKMYEIELTQSALKQIGL